MTALVGKSSSAIAMVRAGEKACLFEHCRDGGFVTIGWFHTPARDMSAWEPDDVLRYKEIDAPIGRPHAHRDGTNTIWTKGKITRDVNQISIFLFDMDVGCKVTVSSPNMEQLIIGEVVKRYEYRADNSLGGAEYPYLHFKPVRWLASIERHDMSDNLVDYIVNRRYQTVFLYDEASIDELLEAL